MQSYALHHMQGIALQVVMQGRALQVMHNLLVQYEDIKQERSHEFFNCKFDLKDLRNNCTIAVGSSILNFGGAESHGIHATPQGAKRGRHLWVVPAYS